MENSFKIGDKFTEKRSGSTIEVLREQVLYGSLKCLVVFNSGLGKEIPTSAAIINKAIKYGVWIPYVERAKTKPSIKDLGFMVGDRFTRADGAEIQVRERTESGAGRYTVAAIKDACITFLHLHGNEIHDLIAAGTWMPVKLTTSRYKKGDVFKWTDTGREMVLVEYGDLLDGPSNPCWRAQYNTPTFYTTTYLREEMIFDGIHAGTIEYVRNENDLPNTKQDPEPRMPTQEDEKRIMSEFKPKLQEGTSDVPPTEQMPISESDTQWTYEFKAGDCFINADTNEAFTLVKLRKPFVWETLWGNNSIPGSIGEKMLADGLRKGFLMRTLYGTKPQPTTDTTVMDEAKYLIYGDREKDYGKTSDNFADIAAMWSVILRRNIKTGADITPEQAALMMAALKICRANKDNCEKRDSLIDLAGYAGCIEKIKKGI